MVCFTVVLLSSTDFDRWKADYENTNESWFVRASGDKAKVDSKSSYYYCNRSGFFKSKSTGKRHLKCQGSSKLSAHCTAAIKVTIHEFGSGLHVEVHHNHYGHRKALGHLRLPETDRLKIAGQIAQGIGFGKILDDVRDHVGTRFSRVHLLTRKDISNIEKAFGLKGTEKHPVDSVSVSIWIKR